MGKKCRKYSMPIGLFLCVIGLLVAGCIFVFESLQCLMIIYNWNNDAIIEYCGEYTYSEERYLRNINYRFVLKNNNVLIVPSEHIANVDFKDHPILSFRYASNQNIFTLGRHRILSIQSKDGSRTLVEEKTTTHELHSGAVGYMVIGVSCLLVVLFPFSFQILLVTLKNKRRKQRNST